MKKLIPLALIGAAVVTGTVFALPGAASAAPTPAGLVTLSRYVYASTVPSAVTGTLACPVGYRVVGSGGGNAQILAEAPVSNFTAVEIVAAVSNPAPGNFAYLTVTCAPAARFADVVTIRTADHRAKPGVFSRGLTRCPAGMYSFGGGGYFESGGGSGFLGSAYANVSNSPSADGNAWTFSGVAPPGASALVTIAQCAPRIGRDFLVQFGNVSVGNNQITSSYVDCPAGYTAIAGGFYASNPDGSEAVPAAVIWNVPATHIAGINSWYASGFSNPNTKMVALAQCLI
jgi:hypothetical protein